MSQRKEFKVEICTVVTKSVKTLHKPFRMGDGFWAFPVQWTMGPYTRQQSDRLNKQALPL